MELVPQSDNDYVFTGTIAVEWVNNETFAEIRLPESFPRRFWENVRTVIDFSSNLYETKLGDLREFDTACAIEWAKL